MCIHGPEMLLASRCRENGLQACLLGVAVKPLHLLHLGPQAQLACPARCQLAAAQRRLAGDLQRCAIWLLPCRAMPSA